VHPMIFPFRVWGMILTTAMLALGAVGLILHSIL